jgi:hypothetical protein
MIPSLDSNWDSLQAGAIQNWYDVPGFSPKLRWYVGGDSG